VRWDRASTKRLAQKARDKKGFTLIEVIVVLVILGILAAIAIPSLVGYIDKANQRTILAEAGSYRTALQAIGTDTVVSGGTLGTVSGSTYTAAVYTGASELPTKYAPISAVVGGKYYFYSELKAYTGSNTLTDSTSGTTAGSITNITYDTSGTLQSFTYSNGSYVAAYTLAGGYAVTKVS
jgi:prepilin-type N-terminal cleavage/methylation domain-containing protein